jgi:hypothetical protein
MYWWFSSSAIRAVAWPISAVLCTTSVRPPLSSVISRRAEGFTRVLIAWCCGASMTIAYANASVRTSDERTLRTEASLAVSAPSEMISSAARVLDRLENIGREVSTASYAAVPPQA